MYQHQQNIWYPQRCLLAHNNLCKVLWASKFTTAKIECVFEMANKHLWRYHLFCWRWCKVSSATLLGDPWCSNKQTCHIVISKAIIIFLLFSFIYESTEASWINVERIENEMNLRSLQYT